MWRFDKLSLLRILLDRPSVLIERIYYFSISLANYIELIYEDFVQLVKRLPGL